MQILAALFTGLLFGIGLTISQMVDPAKVLAFLDIGALRTNQWDPSLALVMIGALAVTGPLYLIARRRNRPLIADVLHMPTRRDIDRPLIVGSLLFGAGWGLVGFCPGPALAGLAFGMPQTYVFVAAMIAGMLIHRFTRERSA